MHKVDPFFKRFGQPVVVGEDERAALPPQLPLCLTGEAACIARHDAPGRQSSNNNDALVASRRRQGGATREDAPNVVMEPIAMLRQCIRYFTSHPETYGTNLRALLDREVLHVMRLKASEMALIDSKPVYVSPEMRNCTTMLTHNAERGSATISTGFLPSLPGSVTTARQRTRDGRARGRGRGGGTGTTTAAASSQPVSGNTSETGLFGYGGVTFMQPTAGLLALLEPGCETTAGIGGGNGSNARSEFGVMSNATAGAMERVTGQMSSHESIAWDGGNGHTHSNNDDNGNSGGGGGGDAARPAAMGTPTRTALEPILSTAATADTRSQLVRQLPGALSSPSTAVVVDGGGYEVDFLRSQLQQLGAAYNAKCMRLHELTEENSRLLTQLKSADETKERWVQTCRTTQAQLERLKVELDAWKERVRDAAMQASSPAQRRGSQTQELVMSNQLQEVKQEVAKLTQLWRDTERALQESRRAFENADKEASHSHDHLSDAFHYIERLERRLGRRDAYIALQSRRQASLEEKYDKLMWCFEELGTMAGTHSFADFLLHDSPVWSLVLFVRMQRHVGDYAPLSLMNAPPAGQDGVGVVVMGGRAKNGGRAALLEGGEERDAGGDAGRRRSGGEAVMQFRRSPGGGVLVDGSYDSWVVYNFIADDVTALRTRRLKGTRLRTNLHGTVACRVLRWCGPFAVDYLGGEDSFPDSCDLNRRKLPLLTLAALVLPVRAADGTRLPSVTAATAGALPTEAPAESPANLNATLSGAENNGASSGDATASPVFDEPIVNSREYDQASIRFLLRAFWQERLRQYTATMQRRVRKLAAQARRRRQRESARNNASSLASADATSGPFGNFGTVTADSDGDVVLNAEDGENDDNVAADDEEAEEDEEAEDEMSNDTFLAALLAFVVRFTNGVASVDGGAESAATATTFARYSVHGVLPKADKSLWDSGRAFFATIIGHNSSNSNAADNQETAADGGGETGDVRLSARARELLAALYYYVMEYKDHDADFRLFYLVSHQRIPEMVGVNFYASLEAFQADCFRAWQARLTSSAATTTTTTSAASRQSGADVTTPSRPTSAMSFSRVSSFSTRMEDDGGGAHRHDHTLRTRTSVEEREEESKFRTDQPLGALCTVVEMLDQAPLAAEEEEIEPDSEGEGYASILPGSTQEATTTHAGGYCGRNGRNQGSNSASSGSNRQGEAAMHEEGNRSLSRTTASFSLTARPSIATSAGRQHSTSGAGANGGGSAERRPTSGGHMHRGGAGPVTTRSRRASMELVHNLREYLASLRVRRGGDVMGASEVAQGQGEKRGEEAGQTAAGGAAKEQSQRLPSAWQALDLRIQAVLGTHHSLLRDYETAMVRKDLDMLKLPQSRARRARFMQVESAALAATRGLLPVTELMRLLHAHCFTTYAVTCCGAPRFSLAATLCATQTDGLDPLSAVGQVPPTEIHLRRLRFALALDQPSSLIHFTRLFDLDGHVGNMTHLYDEYLTLTLDAFLQQQSYWMGSVLRACAARHERYAAEGAEDCDGKVPVSHLKHGFARAFAGLGGLGRAQAFAFVDHLCNYDELLRHENEVRLGQFTDAPFFVNSAADTKAGRSASKRGDSAADPDKSADAQHKSGDEEEEEGEEEEEDDWDFQEEARGCSLLTLALAVRMSYVVWGSNVTEAARRLMLLTSLPPYITSVHDDEALVTYHNHTIYGEDKAEDRARRHNSAGGEQREGGAMTTEQLRTLHQDALQSFEDAMKVAYVHAATRLTHDTGYTGGGAGGGAGVHRFSLNALRQTAYMLQPEVTRRRSDRSVDHASDGAAAMTSVSQRPSLVGLTALEAWGGAEGGPQQEGAAGGGALRLLASRYPDYRTWLAQYALPPSLLRALAAQDEARTAAAQPPHRGSSAASAKSSSRAAKRRSKADEAASASASRTARRSTETPGEAPRETAVAALTPGSPAAGDATLYDLARLLGLSLSPETLLAANALATSDKRGRGKRGGGKQKGGKKRKKGAGDGAGAVPATHVAMSSMGSGGAAAMLLGLQGSMQTILTPHIAVAEQLSRAAESSAERQATNAGGTATRTITSAASREGGGAARAKTQRMKSVVFTEQSDAGATSSSQQERRPAGDEGEMQREAGLSAVGPRAWVLSMDGVDGAGGMERPVYGAAATASTSLRESNVLHVQNLLAGCAALSIL